MSPASCGHCGETAISYGAHLLNMSPRSLCARCGRPVRKRAFRTILLVAALLGIAVGYYAFSAGEGVRWQVVLAALAGALLLDYLTWRLLPWDRDPDAMVYEEEPDDEPAESAERT